MDETTALKQQKEQILQALKSSPTAVPGAQAVTRSDVSNQQRLQQTQQAIDKIVNDKKKEAWYGGEEGAAQNTEKPKKGLLGHALDFVIAPSRFVAGTVDYATGQTNAKSVIEAGVENVTDKKRGFGEILKGVGLPSVVSRPLGFALDVVTDPVNMATAGTSALIPRVFYGFAKGGLKGAGVGAASNLLETGLLLRSVAKGTGKVATKAADSIANKTSSMLRLTPSAEKAAIATTGIPRRIYSRWWDNFSNLGDKAEKASVRLSKQYDEITGTSALSRLAKKNQPSQWRQTFSQFVADAKEANPVLGNFMEAWVYDNAKWHRDAMLKEQLVKSFGTADETNKFIRDYHKAVNSGADTQQAIELAKKEYQNALEKKILENAKKQGIDITQEAPVNPLHQSLANMPVTDDLSEVVTENLEDVTAAIEMAKNPKNYVSFDPVENAYRMSQEAELTQANNVADYMKEIEAIIKKGELGETGWKWFDTLKSRLEADNKFVVNFGKGKGGKQRQASLGKAVASILGALETLTSFFKLGAVGSNPAAWTNAILGNPVMASMLGINIADPKFIRSVKGSTAITLGLDSSKVFLDELFENSDILRVFQETPELFRQTTGLNPRMLATKQKLETVLRDAVETGVIDTATVESDEIIKGFAKELADIADMVRQGGGADNPALRTTMEALNKVRGAIPETPRQNILNTIPEGGTVVSDYTSLSANELLGNQTSRQALKWISEKAKERGPISPLYWLDFSLNKMASGYEKIDQSYKMGTITYLAKEGVTAQELDKISRFVRIEPDQVGEIVVDGVRRYKIDGTKAMEIANEAYLNYNAMPMAVKVLRNTPILGHPFAAFMYGMYIKTGKTFAFNPAFYNNVEFATNAVSSDVSPTEKALLSDPRYNYLKERGMIKIGGESNQFLDTFGMYANVANIFPYLSLNMFTPSERKYDGWGGAVISAIDKSPVLKDPIGQTMFDYFILPNLISDIQRPTGTFGQYLYPQDATSLEKVGYAARTVADAYVPGVLGQGAGTAIGLTRGALGLPEDIAQYLPLSYRGRQISEAIQGRSAVGIDSKEPAVQKTARAAGAAIGIPIQSPVPFEYLDENSESVEAMYNEANQ